MKFQTPELRLMLNAALYIVAIGQQGDQPVALSYLERFFDRPGKLLTVVRELERGGFLLFDPHQNVIRLRLRPILALEAYGDTPELFTRERPLDAALAAVDGEPAAAIGFAPAPPKPKPPEPPEPAPPAGLRSFVRPTIPPTRPLPNSVLNDNRGAGSSRFCLDDGYIAGKLRNHPRGARLRRELAAQVTYTARAFQKYFDQKPAAAREDLAWCLEAANPGARLNTHMAGMSLATAQ